jgi:hypothetical protein
VQQRQPAGLGGPQAPVAMASNTPFRLTDTSSYWRPSISKVTSVRSAIALSVSTSVARNRPRRTAHRYLKLEFAFPRDVDEARPRVIGFQHDVQSHCLRPE